MAGSSADGRLNVLGSTLRAGRMVGRACSGLRHSEHIRNLRHLSCLRRKVLCVGTLPLPVLLSADRPEIITGGGFSSTIDSGWPARIPRDLLLLPKGLLSSILPASPACAVSEGGRGSYRGETSFPFILQNLHRWFLYIALVFLAFLWWDAIHAFFFLDGFGIGVGSLVLLTNIVLLTLYTFSCHSLRHLAGGKLDCFSCTKFGPPRHTVWGRLSSLNERHMLFAWLSLFSVGLADLYVRMVSEGLLKDIRLL